MAEVPRRTDGVGEIFDRRVPGAALLARQLIETLAGGALKRLGAVRSAGGGGRQKDVVEVEVEVGVEDEEAARRNRLARFEEVGGGG